MALPAEVRVKAGPQCIIAADTDFKGSISFGKGTIVHPRALIHSLNGGDIEIGNECIIEELAQIIHRGKEKMIIGDRNLFEAGCRVEAASVGSHNVFEPKSRTLDNVVIQNFSTIGAGCIAQPPANWHLQQQESQVEDHIEDSERYYKFPSRSVVFGQNSQSRLWSGNGVRQADALHAKHLDYLRETIPQFHKLRMI